ncbi:MAG: hypothetical protein WC310_01245 [Patescibacteria group bacterium]|jgi:hypothetical protein
MPGENEKNSRKDDKTIVPQPVNNAAGGGNQTVGGVDDGASRTVVDVVGGSEPTTKEIDYREWFLKDLKYKIDRLDNSISTIDKLEGRVEKAEVKVEKITDRLEDKVGKIEVKVEEGLGEIERSIQVTTKDVGDKMYTFFVGGLLVLGLMVLGVILEFWFYNVSGHSELGDKINNVQRDGAALANGLKEKIYSDDGLSGSIYLLDDKVNILNNNVNNINGRIDDLKSKNRYLK